MRFLLAGLLLLLSPFAASCGTCTLQTCEANLVLHIQDADAKVVPNFFGGLTFAGRTASFACNGVSVAGGNSFTCGEAGVVTILGYAAAGGTYDLTITDNKTQQTYHGPLTATFQTIDDFNGAGCGACSSGVATVTIPHAP